MNPLKTALSALLLASLLAPPAALAADLSDALAAEPEVDCGSIFTHGLIPVTLCLVRAGVGIAAALAKYGFCTAWALLWRLGSPCPLV